ncbi:hypothetical protein [Rhizobium sp. CC-YZS058]|uniref:hypothetical protein n=1 Tax=Rhizobium sp. CC-YZS058 TaxID=3042153 RepID=UPI002B0584DB|nr:hypothetical protein [Rhizobium sp. CC-YZS058]MEA3536037.1 hypothetical protein [Rhizobium sp. CC-YZS058]
MPQSRSEKLKRLVTVQRHLERMAEYELNETARQRQVLGETIDVVVDAMGSGTPLHAMFSGHYSGHLGRLIQKDQMLHGIQQVHESRVLKERAKGDRLEEHMKDARTSEERTAADDAIYDLVDQYVLGGSPASGKLDRP